MANIISIIIAYLLGSISTAIIVCKVARLPDPRTEGSGNPGASNVLRVSGKIYAGLTLLGDALKGFIAIFIAMIIGIHGWMLGIVALAAVLGHVFPVFFKFKGGKGVATAFGCYFALSLPLGLVSVVVWVVIAFVLRYSSVASLTAMILAPFVILLFQPAYFIGLALVALLIVWRHRTNIQRLRNKSEPKFTLAEKETTGGSS